MNSKQATELLTVAGIDFRTADSMAMMNRGCKIARRRYASACAAMNNDIDCVKRNLVVRKGANRDRVIARILKKTRAFSCDVPSEDWINRRDRA